MRLSRPFLLLMLLGVFLFLAGAALGQNSAAPEGIAWRVQGRWVQQTGDAAPAGEATLRSGALVTPGALLVAIEPATAHSITVFLPDGQRILYECFREVDCARGFRIPLLTEKPAALATRLLRAISPVLLEDAESQAPWRGDQPAHTTPPNREEALSVLENGRVSVALPALPAGSYTYRLVPQGSGAPAQAGLALTKTAAECGFALPAAGLYRITISDQENTPRIDLFVAAIEPAEAEAFSTLLPVRKMLAHWDTESYGWPTHEFIRAYLQALAKNTKP